MTLSNLISRAVILLLLFDHGKAIKWPLRSRKSIGNAILPNIRGHASSGFSISVNIGTPPQVLDVILDTGSSNFAIAGAPTAFVDRYYNEAQSSSADDTFHKEVQIKYVEGSWKGTLLFDVVSIPSAGLASPVAVPLTKITTSHHFFLNHSHWQGILGLAYSSIVQPSGLKMPSFMDKITFETPLKNIFSLQLCSLPLNDTTYGSFIIGDTDESLGSGPIEWTPIVKESFYEVRITGLKVGNKAVDVSCSEINNDKSILDSGTTNLRFPTLVYKAVLKLIKESVTDYHFDDGFYDGSRVFCIERNVTVAEWFPKLTISLPSVDLKNTILLILYPQSYVQYMNDDPDGRACYKFLIYPSEIGTVLGTVVMEQYYVIFNREKKRIGFARSSCTVVDTQSPVLLTEKGWVNSTDCLYTKFSSTTLEVAAFVLLGVFVIVAIPMLCLIVKYCLKKKKIRLCCKEDPLTYTELHEN